MDAIPQKYNLLGKIIAVVEKMITCKTVSENLSH